MLAIMKVNDKKIAEKEKKAKEKARRAENNELSEQSEEKLDLPVPGNRKSS